MDPANPAVAKLLSAADEALGMARELQAMDRPGDALACALFANEYTRAARAMQETEDASRAYEESSHRVTTANHNQRTKHGDHEKHP